MLFPPLNKRAPHYKPYPSSWAQVSAELQNLLWNVTLRAKQKPMGYHSHLSESSLPHQGKQVFTLKGNSIWLVFKLVCVCLCKYC